MISKVVEAFLSSIINLGFIILIIKNLTNKEIKFKKFSNWIYFFLAVTCITCISIVFKDITSFVKLIFTTSVIIFMIKSIFKESVRNSIVLSVINQIILLIVEVIVTLIIITVLGIDQLELVDRVYGKIVINLVISIGSLALSYIPKIKLAVKAIIDLVSKVSTTKITILFILLIIVINLLFGNLYYKQSALTLMIGNSVFIIYVIYLLYKMLEENNKKLRERDKNQAYENEKNELLTMLNEYAKIDTQHRMINHENKTQLYSIKNMLHLGIEEVEEYVDGLIDHHAKLDKNLLSKTKIIPNPTLQGTIYQKIMVMTELKINYVLEVSRDIDDIDFRKLERETTIDVCKILGVFLDNAIEEVKTLNKKDIIIELYKEDKSLCIKVSNNYKKNKNFDNIEEAGVTSKGNDHGYGLALVKYLVDNNDKITNERSIGKYFVQVIKVSDMSD